MIYVKVFLCAYVHRWDMHVNIVPSGDNNILLFFRNLLLWLTKIHFGSQKFTLPILGFTYN